MAFGDRLKELRVGAGLTQAKLASRSGASLDTLRNWEQGRSLPSIAAAADLARGLGVSLDELAEGLAASEAPTTPKPKPGTSGKPSGQKRKKPPAK